MSGCSARRARRCAHDSSESSRSPFCHASDPIRHVDAGEIDNDEARRLLTENLDCRGDASWGSTSPRLAEDLTESSDFGAELGDVATGRGLPFGLYFTDLLDKPRRD